MRAVVQRVSRARVSVAGRVNGEIDKGLLVFLGAGQGDGPAQVDGLADKIVRLRVFPDADNKMNLGLHEVGGSILMVSQFTLYGDCSKGNRPSFSQALDPEAAERLCERFVQTVRGLGVVCQTGVFRADMQVELVNDGPVTLLLENVPGVTNS